MPKFSIDHSSQHPAPETFEKLKGFFDKAEDIRRIDPKVQYTFDDAKLTGKANGSQFKADIQVVPAGPGCKVTVTVDLPFLLSPFKGKIQEMISHKLAKYVG